MVERGSVLRHSTYLANIASFKYGNNFEKCSIHMFLSSSLFFLGKFSVTSYQLSATRSLISRLLFTEVKSTAIQFFQTLRGANPSIVSEISKKSLGYDPKISLENGISNFIDWFMNYYKRGKKS